MDGTTLQQKIYAGYARSAAKIGLPYQLFRAASALNPLAGPPRATLPAAFSAEDYRFAKPLGYGQAAWWGLFDGAETQTGDILVGPKTFFIAAQQALAPILVVEAPRLVDLHRPFRETGIGYQAAYGGTTPATETVLMAGWPASILRGGRGEAGMAKLPDDLKASGWDILMPAWAGLQLVTSDIVADDLGRRFGIEAAELTPLGWRLTTLQLEA
jgi:hypothetical protein